MHPHHHSHSRWQCMGGHRGRHGGFGRGPGFLRGFMGGAGFRGARMLASGDLQLIILALLEEKPRHGYDIIKDLEERSLGLYTPSPGVVYPALTYLEEMEFAISETEGNKKLYKITDAGKAHLDSKRAEVTETLEQLARFGKKAERVRKHFQEEEAENEFEREGPRGSREEWRKLKMEFMDLKAELKAALFEKMGASTEEKKRIFGILRKAIDEIRGK